MIKQDRYDKSPQGPKMLGIGSCGLLVIHGTFCMAKSATYWNLKKFLKNCHSSFKKSPARRNDCLAANDLQFSHEGKNMSCLFPLKFPLKWLLDQKKMPKNAFLILQHLQYCISV